MVAGGRGQVAPKAADASWHKLEKLLEGTDGYTDYDVGDVP